LGSVNRFQAKKYAMLKTRSAVKVGIFAGKTGRGSRKGCDPCLGIGDGFEIQQSFGEFVHRHAGRVYPATGGLV
jgi:hypothetical protein